MSRISLPPPARVSIGTAQGPNGPIEFYVSPEWSRYFESLNNMTNETATGPGGVSDINADDSWHDDLNAREALQGVDEIRNEIASLRGENREAMQSVDELRNELASVRSENNQLRQAFDELSTIVYEFKPDIQLRARVEQIEDRLQ